MYEALKASILTRSDDTINAIIKTTDGSKIDALRRHYLKKGGRAESNALLTFVLLYEVLASIKDVASEREKETIKVIIDMYKEKVIDAKKEKLKTSLKGIQKALLEIEENRKLLSNIKEFNDDERRTISIRIPKEVYGILEIFEKYRQEKKIKKSELLKRAIETLSDAILLRGSNGIDEIIEWIRNNYDTDGGEGETSSSKGLNVA